MDTIFGWVDRYSSTLLRFSLAIVLLWIGGLKFVDPEGVVALLQASLPFLAFTGFVYVLGVFEVGAAVLLAAGVAQRYVGILVAGLFVGTLVIFLIAPAVSYGDAGFPRLSLAGEFLLKDIVLLSAALSLSAHRCFIPAKAT